MILHINIYIISFPHMWSNQRNGVYPPKQGSCFTGDNLLFRFFVWVTLNTSFPLDYPPETMVVGDFEICGTIFVWNSWRL